LKFWVDAQLPPQLAGWLAAEFHIEMRNYELLFHPDVMDERGKLAKSVREQFKKSSPNAC
jgi:hypothetical protein